jgi:hypothetical protein
MKQHGPPLLVRSFCRGPSCSRRTCPDNKATREIARQAYRYARKFGAGAVDYTPFTNAYAEACRQGTLSVDFRAFLKSKGMRLSSAA